MVTKSSKPQFTKEQFQAARKVSALEYAKAHGYDLVVVGNRYQMREHDSMIFLPDGRWYWNSTGHYGRALEFMVYYENKTLVEAVLELTGSTVGNPILLSHGERSPSPAPIPFVLPPSNSEATGILVKYLVERRGCDRAIVKSLISEQRIYISCQVKNGYTLRNAIFVGMDRSGEPRSATIRGINYGSSYKGAVPGSDKNIPFEVPAAADATTLAVFEAPIDALSHATLDKQAGFIWTETHRIALGGNPAPHTVETWLQQHPKISKIELCLDNDTAGRNMDARLRWGIAATGFNGTVQSILPPTGKDWNEALLNQKEVTKNGGNFDRTSICHQFSER